MNEPDVLANESWFSSRWRPAMAWLWFAVSACDFILFPILNAAAAGAKLIPYAPWSPITLQGGGLFHMAMGGVVGVAAWRRTNEKLAIYGAGGCGGGLPGVLSERTVDTVTPQPAPQKSSRAD
jgi:hypothetical protein